MWVGVHKKRGMGKAHLLTKERLAASGIDIMVSGFGGVIGGTYRSVLIRRAAVRQIQEGVRVVA